MMGLRYPEEVYGEQTLTNGNTEWFGTTTGKHIYKQKEVDCNILDNLIKAVEQFDLHTTNILLGHPLDLLEMDMKQFPSNCYFISEHFAKRGELLMVKNEELKEELYKFVKTTLTEYLGERTILRRESTRNKGILLEINDVAIFYQYMYMLPEHNIVVNTTD